MITPVPSPMNYYISHRMGPLNVAENQLKLGFIGDVHHQ